MLLDLIVTRMFDDALADAKRQIEPAVCGVTLFEVLDDAQRMQVVVEPAAMTSEAAVQCALSGMSEGRMADVVDQRESLSEIFVQTESRSSRASNLRDLNGVGQPAAKVIGGAASEDLRLSRKTAEGARLHHAFAVALKWSA